MLDQHLIVKTSPAAHQENVILWGDYRVTLLGECLIRIEKDKEHKFLDEATLSVWYRDAKPVPHTVNFDDKALTVTTGKVTLYLTSNMKTSYVVVEGEKRAINNRGNLLGTYRTLDECNADWRCKVEEKLHKIKLENGVLSKNGLAVVDDTKTPVLGTDGMPHERRKTDLDIYVFAYGKDYRGAIRGLYQITGSTPLLPRFAFGNWWSRYHDYTDREYLHVMDRLAGRDVPLTVATVDMDWHWSREALDEEFKFAETGKHGPHYGVVANEGRFAGWTGYSWNTRLFPDYKGFLKELEKRNLKVTLNLHPSSGVRFFEDMYPEMAKAVGIDPKSEAVIPFDITDPKFINAYFRVLHKPYEKDGVEFWWMDWQQGCNSNIPGVDPLWCLNHFHHLDNGVNHTPLLLSRYCNIGSHRYPVGFSGDTYITWDTLNYLPYFTANASNAGYTWWSHDIGGHMFGYNDPELYTRFVQFGVFSPINRLHCTSNPTCTKEPSVFLNGCGMVAEEALRFRHKLIPYLYTASYDTRDTGRALIEPMYYEHPEAKEAYQYKNQYYFGKELLVAPVTAPKKRGGLSLAKVWLPEGHFTDIFTGDEYDGGRVVTMARWLESIPVLLKEGGILPLDARVHTNDVSNPESLQVLVANGNGRYTLIEDKGEQVAHTVFTNTQKGNTQTVSIVCDDTGDVVPNREMRLEFRNIQKGEISVLKDGNPYPYTWDDDGYMTVTLKDMVPGATYEVCVTYPERDALQFTKDRFMWGLQRVNLVNNVRGDMAKKLNGAKDLQTIVDIVRELVASADVKARLLDQIPEV